jgi:hypothetical protein
LSGEEIMEIIIREWYKIMKASERASEREREKRRESGVTKRVRTPRHIALSRAHHFWLLSFCVCFFFIIFVTPLNGWKRGVCVGVEKDKVI